MKLFIPLFVNMYALPKRYNCFFRYFILNLWVIVFTHFIKIRYYGNSEIN